MPAPLEATMFAIIPDGQHVQVGDMQPKVWPHITVVPWVQLGEHRHDILVEADEVVKRVVPLELKPGGMTMVGEKDDEPAQRIISEQLRDLHKQLLTILGGFGIVVSHPEWAYENYNSHITAPRRVMWYPKQVERIHVIDNLALRPGEPGTKVIAHTLGSLEHEI